MRFVATLTIAAITAAASAQTAAPAKPAVKPRTATTTATHRPTASTPRTTLPADPKATEGIAAVGTMPAATGAPAPLYTLKYIDLKVGDGELAGMSTPPNNVVFLTVHYTGWLTDGTKFDSSVDRGEPFVFPIGAKRVIAGWDTGFEGMRVGGKRRLIIPWQLAYGAAGHPPVIPEKADLIFDMELLGQGNTPEPVTGTHFGTPDTAAPAAKAPAVRPEEHQE